MKMPMFTAGFARKMLSVPVEAGALTANWGHGVIPSLPPVNSPYGTLGECVERCTDARCPDNFNKCKSACRAQCLRSLSPPPGPQPCTTDNKINATLCVGGAMAWGAACAADVVALGGNPIGLAFCSAMSDKFVADCGPCRF